MTCDHTFVQRAHVMQSECVACLRDRLYFEHSRWQDTANAYAVERSERQSLQVEVAGLYERLAEYRAQVERDLGQE